MKVLIINGSPKGKYSITLQTSLYIQKHFNGYGYEVLNVGQGIKGMEKDFSKASAALMNADLIVFSYPVYTCLATAQLTRFIELIFENGVDLSGKVATQISTSKHFFDQTAHRYIEEICGELGMHYIKGLSADMNDLTTPEGRSQALGFFKFVEYCIANNSFEPPLGREKGVDTAYASQAKAVAKTDEREVVIVTNCAKSDSTLSAMIEDFIRLAPFKTRIFDINEFGIRGGCLGCLKCAKDGECVYTDGFAEELRERIQTAPATIYAFRIYHHNMGADFKMYFDRNFCNGHRTLTAGKPTGYLVAGDLSVEPNVREVLESRSEVGGNFLARIATASDGIEGIQMLADRLEFAMQNNLTLPSNFYGVGGMMIFRDLVYLMRGVMVADHRFYKKVGLYKGYPQRHKLTIFAMKLAGAAMNNRKLSAKLGSKIQEGMLMPYKKAMEADDKE